jgi:capsular exopolysaccharide synthesis family protein
VSAEVEQHPEVQAALQEIKRLRVSIEVNLRGATQGEAEPLVKELRERLKTAREALDVQRKQLRPEALEALRVKARAKLAADTAVLQSKVEVLEDSIAFYKSETERLQNLLQTRTKHGADLDLFREDLSHIEKLNKRIIDEETALNVELDAPKREHVLEPAVIAAANSKSKRLLMTYAAGMGGLALGLLAVALLEFRAQRVDTADEVAEGLGMAVVGALPDSSRPVPRRRVPRGMSAADYAEAILTESVDATRTMLLHAARVESVQVVMITSAVAGEGKTSLSCHLAASLARAGFRTLLIDGDLRNPTAHRLFELPNDAGFCELLRGEADLAQVTRPTVLPELSVITGGQWDGRAAQGLAQHRALDLFARLRAEYDLILVDSSPVLPVADALLIGQSADAVIFSVLREVSRLPSLQLASQRLAALGVRTLGAVLSGVPGGLYVSSYTYTGVGKSSAAPAEGA